MPSNSDQVRLTLVTVFEHASYFSKGIMIVLVLSTLAALVVLALKLASGSLSGGSAYLSGLRLGGPIIGLLGACYAGLCMALAVANGSHLVTLKVLAPGFAEIFLIVGLGFLAGVVAVFANWAVESRIDRQVLSA